MVSPPAPAGSSPDTTGMTHMWTHRDCDLHRATQGLARQSPSTEGRRGHELPSNQEVISNLQRKSLFSPIESHSVH